MGVNDIDVVILDNPRQLVRQSQRIGRIAKERIGRNIDPMIVNSQGQWVESEGSLVGDEMNLVPILCQSHSQLGSDHTTSSMGRVTDDGDLHLRYPHLREHSSRGHGSCRRDW